MGLIIPPNVPYTQSVTNLRITASWQQKEDFSASGNPSFSCRLQNRYNLTSISKLSSPIVTVSILAEQSGQPVLAAGAGEESPTPGELAPAFVAVAVCCRAVSLSAMRINEGWDSLAGFRSCSVVGEFSCRERFVRLHRGRSFPMECRFAFP